MGLFVNLVEVIVVVFEVTGIVFVPRPPVVFTNRETSRRANNPICQAGMLSNPT